MSEVDCTAARNVLSADLDQEALPYESTAGQAHLTSCVHCQKWWSEVTAVHRQLRIRSVDAAPDLATAVLARVQPVAPGRREWVRWTLAVVALTELALALPGLFAGHGAASIHDGRHIGSFGSALATGLLYVAWRPMRAFGILPIVASLAATMAVAVAVDISNGRVSSLGEAHHLLELAGLSLVWMLAGRPLPERLKSLRSESAGRRAVIR